MAASEPYLTTEMTGIPSFLDAVASTEAASLTQYRHSSKIGGRVSRGYTTVFEPESARMRDSGGCLDVRTVNGYVDDVPTKTPGINPGATWAADMPS